MLDTVEVQYGTYTGRTQRTVKTVCTTLGYSPQFSETANGCTESLAHYNLRKKTGK